MLKSSFQLRIGLLLAGLCVAACGDRGAIDDVNVLDQADRPNFLLIVVDDMGYSDIGSFGGEIETPNIDKLAFDGIRFTDFQVASTCSPTRSMLLTGVDHHKAGLGNMLEELSPNQKGQPGYEGYLNDRVVTIATLLQDAGYQTLLSGKWHLGGGEKQRPPARGFDRSFSLLTGGASHFADMRPAYAPSPDIKAAYSEDGVMLEALPAEFEYSSQYYADRLIDYLDTPRAQDQPFFAYLSFTAPHWPLQAPAATVAKYKGRYDQGYDALLAQRLAKSKKLGVTPGHALANKAPPAYVPWAELNAERRQRESRAMEIYAAMIDEIDRHTGRVIEHLRNTGKLDNTVIIFLSDNGAEGHDLDETWPADIFPDIRKTIDTVHDFSFEAMGQPGSYVLYGHGWARAASPALSLYKAFPSEGGTRVAAFMHYPRLFPAGAVSNELVSVQDIAPTVLAIAGVEHPGTTYRERPVEAMTGKSLLALLKGEDVTEAFAGRALGSELFGKRAIRYGDWKIVHMPAPYGNGDWQLFNLQTDLAERQDLAAEQPEKLLQLQSLWQQYYDDNNLILPDWVSGY